MSQNFWPLSTHIAKNVEVQYKESSMEKRISNYMLAVGWGLFVVSLFLPVTDLSEMFGGIVSRPGVVYGWSAFVTSILALRGFGESWSITLIAMEGISNLLMILSPFMLCVRKPKQKLPFVFAMLAATLVNCAGFFNFDKATPLIGFHIWCISFAIVTVSFYLRRKIEGEVTIAKPLEIDLQPSKEL